MKKKVLFALFAFCSLFVCKESHAQYLDPHFAIYFTSPTGLLSKGGVKAEYRLNLQHALLLSYTQYWGYFPGYQGDLEYRAYFAAHSRFSSSENFIYGKAGLGYAGYTPNTTYNQATSIDGNYTKGGAPGTYVFGGGGIGRHINFNWFFVELNAGLKFAQITGQPHVYNERLFYLTGPGSIADFNFHFGIQF